MSKPTNRFDRVKRSLFRVSSEKGKFGEALVARGYITAEQLAECLREQDRLQQEGQEFRLGQILLQRGYLSTARFLEALASHEQAETAMPGTVPAEPNRIGRYVILREIARGGMGVVYEAEDPELKRRVALKVLREGDAGQQVTARLHREAAIAAQLQHANIVTIHEVGTVRGPDGRLAHFIAMEYVEGKTLADLLGSGRTARNELLRMVEDIARAVAYAHEKGVIHRDLKPANVLVDPSGRVVLTDFGLARADTFRTQLTRSQAVMGTPQYMAPEQVEGRTRDIDARTDVYALGVILYEVLTGTIPFQGETPAALYRQILQDDPRKPSTIRRQIASDLEVICLKAMDKDRLRRYPSALDFADDLARYRRGEPIHARPPSVLYLVRKRIARRKGLFLTLGSALAVGALLGTLLWQGKTYIDDAQTLQQLQAELKPFDDLIRDVRAFFYVSRDRTRVERMDQALDEVERIVDSPRYGRHAIGWLHLGRGRYYLGDLERAERALQKAIQLDASLAEPHFYLGKLCVERAMLARLRPEDPLASGDERRLQAREWLKQAAVHLQRAAADWKDAEALPLHLAKAYEAFARGDVDSVARLCAEGNAAFRSEFGQDEFSLLLGWTSSDRAALDHFSESISKRPFNALAHLYRGTLHEAAGSRAAARDDYQTAVHVAPRLPQAHIRYARALALAGELDAAIYHYSEALKLAPQDALVRCWLASVRIRKGAFEAAVSDLNEAVGLDPRLAYAFTTRATAWTHLKDFDRALEDCDKAIRLAPLKPDPYLQLGNVWLGKGHEERALDAYREALARDGNHAETYHARGNLYFQKRNYDQALIDYSAALRIRPTAELYGNRAGIYLLKQDAPRALEDFSKVLELDPRNLVALFNRGLLYAALGTDRAAETDLALLLRICPSDWPHRPQAEIELRRIRARLGD